MHYQPDKVYLNGELFPKSEIAPEKHIFVGVFRLPFPPHFEPGIIICPCGEYITQVPLVYKHWQEGHFDMLTYKSIR